MGLKVRGYFGAYADSIERPEKRTVIFTGGAGLIWYALVVLPGGKAESITSRGIARLQIQTWSLLCFEVLRLLEIFCAQRPDPNTPRQVKSPN